MCFIVKLRWVNCESSGPQFAQNLSLGSANMSLLLLLLLALFGLVALLALRGRKRRAGEPPLIKGWIPFLGKAVEFGRDPYVFLQEQRKKSGDVFTVLIAGRYMTFITDPLLYPSVIKHGRQLDFHSFADKVAPRAFGYPPVRNRYVPGLHEDVQRTFTLLQGENLGPLTESMMANLMTVLRQDYLGDAASWRNGCLLEFCRAVMFESSFLTLYGKPASGSRHSGMVSLSRDLEQFDQYFPLLVAGVPITVLRRAQSSRQQLIHYFLPRRMSSWSSMSCFIRRRQELFEQIAMLTDTDKGAHHFAILWASVANTVPASFWTLYHLVSHPAALKVVRQEIVAVLERAGIRFSSDKDVTLSKEQLDQLLFLDSSIRESLRLSTASMNIRVAQEDFNLRLDAKRSAAVREGDIVVLYPQSLHMDPEIYEEPQAFCFDRYVQDGQKKTDFYKDGQRLKYFLMPFGSGATKCPGRFFAINEIKQFVCLVLLYFQLELDDMPGQAKPDPSRAGLGVLSPSTDICFHYRLRSI